MCDVKENGKTICQKKCQGQPKNCPALQTYKKILVKAQEPLPNDNQAPTLKS